MAILPIIISRAIQKQIGEKRIWVIVRIIVRIIVIVIIFIIVIVIMVSISGTTPITT